MIVKMKKVSVITLEEHREQTLEKLRELGVLHIFTDRIVLDSDEHLKEQKSRLERTLTMIPPLEGKEKPADPAVTGDAAVDAALELSEKILDLADRRAQLEDERDRYERELERILPWGTVDPDRISSLAEKGVRIHLYEVSRDKEQDALTGIPRPIVIERTKALVRVLGVAVGEDEAFPTDIQPFTLPEHSNDVLKHLLEERRRQIEEINTTLDAHKKDISLFEAALQQLEEDLEFTRVRAGMEHDRRLQWITGFTPHDQVEPVKEAAGTNGWGVVLRDPDPNEQVPTEIRNPRPIGIIQPVFKLLGTVPGYRELDISFFFLIFFTVFFAMIIGDGGYGLVLLGGSLFAVKKTREQNTGINPGLVLMLVLSTATVIWGAITGNWFGHSPFNELPVLRSLVIPEISIDNEASTELIQYMCFVIGTVHLSIAHVWRFIRGLQGRPLIKAFEHLGWLSMVLGLYYLVLQLVIDPDKYPMPDFALTMIVAGFVGVILFSAQEEGRNFFVGVGMGLAGIITAVLDSISAFSDIVSYIRLFAVGLATLAIAESFNSMAGGVADGLGGVPGAVVAVLILFLGHTLNLAMGALSVVVHGVRLNMLEFSQHLGMEWTGVEYAPFKTRS